MILNQFSHDHIAQFILLILIAPSSSTATCKQTDVNICQTGLNVSVCAGSVLPPASLQLLVPPVRLMSAFIWRLMQHNRVLQYDKVLDFITLTTSIVPELLSPRQKAQLTMDLRARVRPELIVYARAFSPQKI